MAAARRIVLKVTGAFSVVFKDVSTERCLLTTVLSFRGESSLRNSAVPVCRSNHPVSSVAEPGTVRHFYFTWTVRRPTGS